MNGRNELGYFYNADEAAIQIASLIKEVLPEYQYDVYRTMIAVRRSTQPSFCFVYLENLNNWPDDKYDCIYNLSDPEALPDVICDVIISALYAEGAEDCLQYFLLR